MSSAHQAYSFTSGKTSSSMLFSEASLELHKLRKKLVTKHVACYPWLIQSRKKSVGWMLLLHEKVSHLKRLETTLFKLTVGA